METEGRGQEGPGVGATWLGEQGWAGRAWAAFCFSPVWGFDLCTLSGKRIWRKTKEARRGSGDAQQPPPRDGEQHGGWARPRSGPPAVQRGRGSRNRPQRWPCGLRRAGTVRATPWLWFPACLGVSWAWVSILLCCLALVDKRLHWVSQPQFPSWGPCLWIFARLDPSYHSGFTSVGDFRERPPRPCLPRWPATFSVVCLQV